MWQIPITSLLIENSAIFKTVFEKIHATFEYNFFCNIIVMVQSLKIVGL